MKAKYKHLKENNTYLIIFKNEIWKQNTIKNCFQNKVHIKSIQKNWI